MLYKEFFSPVLLVDDEPLVLKRLAQVVAALGYIDVRTASSFEEARHILETTAVGILISDVALPDGDGRRLALEALQEQPDAQIILISGFSAQSLMLAPELRGRVHLLEKPFGMNDLRGLLTSFDTERSVTKRMRA